MHQPLLAGKFEGGGAAPTSSQDSDLELFDATEAGQHGAKGAKGAEGAKGALGRSGLPEGAIEIAVTKNPKGSVHICQGRYS